MKALTFQRYGKSPGHRHDRAAASHGAEDGRTAGRGPRGRPEPDRQHADDRHVQAGAETRPASHRWAATWPAWWSKSAAGSPASSRAMPSSPASSTWTAAPLADYVAVPEAVAAPKPDQPRLRAGGFGADGRAHRMAGAEGTHRRARGAEGLHSRRLRWHRHHRDPVGESAGCQASPPPPAPATWTSCAAWVPTRWWITSSSNSRKQLRDYDAVLGTAEGPSHRESVGILKPGGRIASLVGPLDAAFARTRGLNVCCGSSSA
jgi:hypothetical protein